MDDFKALLNKQIQKATAAAEPHDKPAPKVKPQAVTAKETPPKKAEPAPVAEAAPVPAAAPQRAPKKAGKGIAGRNTNRVTVNLFEADSRALGLIKELLSTAGHDFTSRSDSMKVGLRLAAKAKPEELARLLEQVRSEDRRFRSEGE